jgi:type VI secretion system protein ImpJ
MTSNQKVLWTEGLFLNPHHFQQWDRYYEELLSSKIRSLYTFGWGAEELEFNVEGIPNGVFEVLTCKAVLPDGLRLDIPGTDAPPPSRAFSPAFPPDSERLGVYIGVPVLRPGSANLAADDEDSSSMARYRQREVSLPDENTGENPQPLVLAAKNLRLLFGEDSIQNHVAIKIAELKRTGEGKVVLEETFIPPVLFVSASKTLTDIVRRLYEILTAKSTTLSEQRRQRSQGLANFTTTEAANFWLLHTVNSYIPLIAHYHHVQRLHPEQLYLAMARLAAELTTFVTEGSPAELPKYYHTDLSRTFIELDLKLRVLLETVLPTLCVPIPLERTRESLYVGRIMDDRLFTHAEFYLGVSAKMPETQLIERVPRKSKIASLDTINYLLGQALPGVTLNPVQVPPGPVPVRMGFKYFRLEKLGAYWNAISASRNICLFFPAEFPDLKLELFAVKD